MNLHRKIYIPVFLTSFLLFSCSNEYSLNLHGKIDNYHSKEIQLEFLTLNRTDSILSTTINKNGKFHFSTKSITAGLYALNLDDKKWILYLDDNEFSVQLSDDKKQKIIIEKGDDKGVIKAIEYTQKLQYTVDSLKKNAADINISNIDINQLIKNFIESDTHFYSSVYLLNMLNFYSEIDFIIHQLDKFSNKFQQTIYFQEYKERIERALSSIQSENKLLESTGEGTMPVSYTKNDDIIDIEGNKYKTIQMGEQIWLAQNLNTSINNSWCFKNEPLNCDIYGRQYTWAAAMEACPEGWKLPSDEDWKKLELYLGMDSIDVEKKGWRGTIQGALLKSPSNLWNKPNGGTSDSLGFNALPGGPRYIFGQFGLLGHNATFWTSTPSNNFNAYFRYLNYQLKGIGRDDNERVGTHSVRCIKVNK